MELFTIIFIGYVYYIARKDGQIVFKLSGHEGLIRHWLDTVYESIKPMPADMSYSKREPYMKEASMKLRDLMAQDLEDISFSRMKIHDLNKAVIERVDCRDDRRKNIDAQNVVNDTFKLLIRQYDKQKNHWS